MIPDAAVEAVSVAERDELADVIARRRYAKNARPSVWITGRAAREVADVILAAGYQRPRTTPGEPMSKQSERDEAIDRGARVLIEEGQFGVPWDDASEDAQAEVVDIVRAILEAAETHMNRTITTVEELDALPVGSVVSHDEGWGLTVAERHVSDRLWYVTGCLEYIRSEALLPATVLHEATP